ncbi:MAG: HAD hydrolase-like protein [Candidatus Pacearchaeota archaeon]
MEKPIIATTLSGLFIKQEPWDKAHILWYEKAAKRLKDESVKEWAGKPDYFNGVDEVMQRLYPNLSEDERTSKARKMFFDSVLVYIKKHPKVKNEQIIKYFKSLKKEYQLVLITTNTKSALEKILSVTNLEDLFDIIETSKPEEKDDKRIVFDKFVRKYGKPILYIGGNKKDSFDYCKEQNIPCIFANLKRGGEIEKIKSIHNLRELKKEISKI